MRPGVNIIRIQLPFLLNEDVARLAGMMPDGSLIKDLKRVYFTQKKDFRKIEQFRNLVIKLFNPSNTVFIRQGHGAHEAYFNSKVLTHFLHYHLDFKRSDQAMRIPSWVFYSPPSVKYGI